MYVYMGYPHIIRATIYYKKINQKERIKFLFELWKSSFI